MSQLQPLTLQRKLSSLGGLRKMLRVRRRLGFKALPPGPVLPLLVRHFTEPGWPSRVGSEAPSPPSSQFGFCGFKETTELEVTDRPMRECWKQESSQKPETSGAQSQVLGYIRQPLLWAAEARLNSILSVAVLLCGGRSQKQNKTTWKTAGHFRMRSSK